MDGWPDRVDLGGRPAEQAAGGRSEGSSEPPGRAEYRCRVRRTAICGRCDAPDSCCYCAADMARLRRFATRMAMIHQPTGTGGCGCGTHACYVRTRPDRVALADRVLDDVWCRFTTWLWHTTGLTGGTLVGALVIAAVFGWLWHASR